MPPLIFDSAFAIRIPRVSAFLPAVTQQIHSLRASGVISSHFASAALSAVRAFLKSAGILCATPFEICFLLMKLFYRIFRTKPYVRLAVQHTERNQIIGILRLPYSRPDPVFLLLSTCAYYCYFCKFFKNYGTWMIGKRNQFISKRNREK